MTSVVFSDFSMRQSQLLSKTQKTPPKDEESTNAKLLVQAGFVHKEMAGVYSFLPLGWRVMTKIMQIIREEMNAIGAQEVHLSSLQNPELWKQSGRWDDQVIDVWFKTHLKSEHEIGLATTHEEPLTAVMKSHIRSWRDLPVFAYQFQTKFRNEVRAKSGILRTREFIMKDLYSFCATQEEHDEFYEKAKQAYYRIFKRVGLAEVTYLTFASGGSFSKYSHEFQTLCDAGEDVIYIDETQGTAINEEIIREAEKSQDVSRLKKAKAIEVGNIFSLGTKFSDALGLTYQNENGEKVSVIMGSYGIGPARTMGTVVEVRSDERGMVWPVEITPFHVHLLALPGAENAAEKLCGALETQRIEVLYDDRTEVSAGEKFADADLIGIPYRVVVSPKTLAKKSCELKMRSSEAVELVELRGLSTKISSLI